MTMRTDKLLHLLTLSADTTGVTLTSLLQTVSSVVLVREGDNIAVFVDMSDLSPVQEPSTNGHAPPPRRRISGERVYTPKQCPHCDGIYKNLTVHILRGHPGLHVTPKPKPAPEEERREAAAEASE